MTFHDYYEIDCYICHKRILAKDAKTVRWDDITGCRASYVDLCPKCYAGYYPPKIRSRI